MLVLSSTSHLAGRFLAEGLTMFLLAEPPNMGQLVALALTSGASFPFPAGVLSVLAAFLATTTTITITAKMPTVTIPASQRVRFGYAFIGFLHSRISVASGQWPVPTHL